MTPTPHDALFKATFSNPARAAELLAAILGPIVAARIDLANLKLVDGSFIDEALRHRQSDLLFQTNIAGHHAHLYLLFEHQSGPEWFMALRLLRYLLNIWEAFLRDHPDARRLPVIIPVVLYHGDTGWHCPTEFSALLDLPYDADDALRAFVPRFRYALDDLGDGGSAALRARALSAAVLLPLLALLEGRSDRSLADLLHGWADLLRSLRRAPDGLGALRLLLRYLCEVRDDVAAQPVAAILRDIDPRSEDTMPTTAEVLRQEGHLRGHKEGLRQAVKIMLRTRFGDVPERMLRRVDEADVATLERMTARTCVVATLDELLDD